MGGYGASNGLVANFAATVMGIAGVIDNFLLVLMAEVGILQPQWQLFVLLVLICLVVMMVMRTLGGLFGWFALLFGAVLLLHYILPAIGQQS